mmetsp:Transcript_33320/g.91904  ORF Transcript_33320/g.91904 Transcript_33320/m.91904 type:complete len:387 (-) Transcript_33320:650-1810(-)
MSSHKRTMLVEFPADSAPISVHPEDATFCVLRANGAAECVLIPTVPAPWRMPATKDALVLVETRLARLKFSSLLHAGLPQVVTNVAEVSGAKTEVMRLALATIPTFPSKELGTMFRALELSLRSAAPAHELHSERSLNVFIQILLFLRPAAFDLTTIIRLVALRAFEESHLGHRQRSDPILVHGVMRAWCRSALLDDPALQRLPPNLLVHCKLRPDVRIDGRMLHDGLAQWTAYALERQAPASGVPLSHDCLCTVVVQHMAASKLDRRRRVERLGPANGAPVVAVGQLCRRLRLLRRRRRQRRGRRRAAHSLLPRAFRVKTRQAPVFSANAATPMPAVRMPLATSPPLFLGARKGRREPFEVVPFVVATTGAGKAFRASHLRHAWL